MFYNCKSLKSIDLSFIPWENISRAGNIFRGCSGLKSVSGLNPKGEFDISNLLSGCTSLQGVFDLTGIAKFIGADKAFPYSPIDSTKSFKVLVNIDAWKELCARDERFDIIYGDIHPILCEYHTYWEMDDEGNDVMRIDKSKYGWQVYTHIDDYSHSGVMN